MTLLELLILSAGLAMDASAVAICKGACMRRFSKKEAVLIAVSFGLFQAAMPLIGWALGNRFIHYIRSVDHWIAFVLLAALGGKMIWDAVHEEDELVCEPLMIKELLLFSVATSIDALAAGIAFAVLEVNIVLSVAVIGGITLVLSLLGAVVGCRFGEKYRGKAQIVGGVALCAIGLKILIDHMAA